jgi:hypothetical protein
VAIYVDRTRKKRKVNRVLFRKPERKTHLGNLDIEARIILKCILNP